MIVRLDLGLARFVCIIALRKCDGPDESRYHMFISIVVLARFARPLCLDIRDLLKVPGVVPRVHGSLRPVAPVPLRQCRAPCCLLALARFSRPHPIITDTTTHAQTDMALHTDVALRSQLRHALLGRTYNTRAR